MRKQEKVLAWLSAGLPFGEVEIIETNFEGENYQVLGVVACKDTISPLGSFIVLFHDTIRGYYVSGRLNENILYEVEVKDGT